MTEFEFNSSLIKIKPDLFRFAMKLTKNRDDSLDLIQDTYVRAIKKMYQFENDTNFKAWTFTILKHIFISTYQRNKLHNLLPDILPNQDHLIQISDKNHISPESEITEKEIIQAINSLNYLYQVPFKMFIHGYTYLEIKNELDINLGTVKSRIFLARKKLIQKLKYYGN